MKKSEEMDKKIELEEEVNTKRYQNNILQCIITRIIKSWIGQKTTHAWLINETSKQVDLFRAHPQQIKESIEKLIEKILRKEIKIEFVIITFLKYLLYFLYNYF